MQFTPDSRLSSHEQHSAWASMKSGPRVNVALQYSTTVALYVGADGFSATLKFSRDEARALAAELVAAADAQALKEAA